MNETNPWFNKMENETERLIKDTRRNIKTRNKLKKKQKRGGRRSESQYDNINRWCISMFLHLTFIRLFISCFVEASQNFGFFLGSISIKKHWMIYHCIIPNPFFSSLFFYRFFFISCINGAQRIETLNNELCVCFLTKLDWGTLSYIV